ncbi:MAG TPA: metallophosphoesterase [Jiangellales bacterium]|nr:metallophosphoesterase [Jiangellales bacterium]
MSEAATAAARASTGSPAPEEVRAGPPGLPRPEAWARRALPAVRVVLVGLLGAWLALLVAGTSTATVGPLQMEAGIVPAFTGETVVAIEPVGTLVVDSHDAPLAVRMRVTAIDEAGVRALVDDPSSLSTLDDRLVADLSRVLRDAAIRSAVVASLGAALAGFLVLRTWRRAALCATVALGATGAAYGLAWTTYDPDAALTPRFTGLLATAPSLVGSVQDIATNFDAYADQLAAIVTNVGKLYDTTAALPTFAPGDDTVRVLHVSDLHLNPAAWDVISAVVDQYDIDVVVDTGDIADHGTAPESRYVDGIARVGAPYVYVRGNHDSILTEAAVAAQPNAVVLDGEVRQVAGLRFLGAPDPRFTPDQQTRGTASEDLRRASQAFAELAADTDPVADVLVFHDPTHAELLDGTAPLLLSGHAHRRRTLVLPEGMRVMVQGSTGGAGLRALEGEEPTPVMLSVLYLDRESGELQAWDDITLGGLGLTSAEIRRQLPDGPPDEESVDEAPGDGESVDEAPADGESVDGGPTGSAGDAGPAPDVADIGGG